MKNKFEIRGDVTAIFCEYKGKGYETLIDTVDLTTAQSYPHTWWLKPSRDKKHLYVYGSMRNNEKKNKVIKMHRFLTDAPKGMEVDHFNHDTLDNRRSSNLRVMTHGENNQNLLASRSYNKSSGIRGVTFDKSRGKWIARVSVNKKHVYKERFDLLEEATIAASEARAVHFPYSIEATTLIVRDPSKYIKK